MAPPSPTTTKGAQNIGWAKYGASESFMSASIARRKASARPISGDAAVSLNMPVVSFTAAFELIGQCETKSARVPA